MNDIFRKWLTSLNARRIFSFLLAAFALQLFLLSKERLQSQQPPESAISHKGRRGSFAHRESAASDYRGHTNSADSTASPFFSPFMEEAILARQSPGESADKGAAPGAPAAGAENANAAADPEAELPEISIMYRGMLRRSDGKTVAFVDNLTEDTTANYMAGDKILGYNLISVDRDEITLEDAAKNTTVIPVNKARTVKGEMRE